MKTAGIAMLFGLCTLIGMRLAAKKTERLKTLRRVKGELRRFAERIAAGCGTLMEASREQGTLAEILSAYLGALQAGETESAAADRAIGAHFAKEADHAAFCAFLTGLSAAARSDLLRRTQTLSEALDRAEREAEAEAKQARVIRVSGVLIGAGIAILLL